MDAFQLVQEFFKKMQCVFCNHSFKPSDIELLREEDSVMVVNVFCHRCHTQNGVAMVGIESHLDMDPRHGFEDPELPEHEMIRLSEFEPIAENDVLAAHEFFGNLGQDWQKHIPKHLMPDTLVTDDTEVFAEDDGAVEK